MTRRDDAQEICDRLNEDVESIIGRFWPNWIRQGDKALLTPRQKGKLKRLTSSFVVELKQNRGRWYRHSQNVGGFGLQLLYYGHTGRLPNGKSDNREAFQYAREHLGIEQRQETDEEIRQREERQEREREDRAKRAAAEAAKVARKREYRALTAKSICDSMLSIKGTPAEAYLVGRGIAPVAEWPWDPDGIIGFISEHEYEREAAWDAGRKIKEGRRFPCLIARVVDAFGETIACWQIYLNPDSPTKNVLVDEPKVGLGPAGGGAVRIGGHAPRIGAAEGLESALAAWEMERYRYPVWSMLSTGGVRKFEPPLFVERITGWPDGDKAVLVAATREIQRPPGIDAQLALQSRMRSAGIAMAINEPTRDGDALDLLIARKKFEAKQAGREFRVQQ